MSLSKKRNQILNHRFGLIGISALILCIISFTTRLTLLIYSAKVVDWGLLNVISIFITGLLFDLCVTSFLMIPMVIYLWLSPTKWHKTTINQCLIFVYVLIVVFTLSFNAFAEFIFWDEFAVRYNFIAVDYLVYTTEVIGNIQQSYPINTLLIILAVLSISIVYLLRKVIDPKRTENIRFKQRSKIAIALLFISIIAYFFVDHKWKYQRNNQYVNELSGNGIYDFGYAFWHNELDYDTFYQTLPLAKVETILHQLLDGKATKFTSREITDTAKANRMNVVLISVESLSAEFLGSFGNQQHITPCLDSLAKNGLLFTNLYASGTRTVRGLEALSLAIPPTPGQSIIKRPNNKNMFTLGNVLRQQGYNSRFIYGGYGYFDNMSEFFGNNGYEVTDRKALNDNEIHYSNIWGVADEDLFTLSLREVDKDYKNNKPFFAHIMTVSNHRPYTYPEGRIDIPSHTGREGAVKYTDYAIGKFIDEAKLKPWFKNTLFVIVADHCASSAGKVELPVDKYHIPMIMYSPGNISIGKVEQLTSQIDIAPTILGLLHCSYQSKFFGQDIFKIKAGEERAFISTYQSLGYLKNGKLITLDPNKKNKTQLPDFKSGNAINTSNDMRLTEEAVSYYQLAAYLYKNHGYQFN